MGLNFKFQKLQMTFYINKLNRLLIIKKGSQTQVINFTVVLKRKSKWHDLWSKWPISDLTFYNIKMPPSSCPLGFSLLLTGAIKWGTVQTSTSTDTGIMKGHN